MDQLTSTVIGSAVGTGIIMAPVYWRLLRKTQNEITSLKFSVQWCEMRIKALEDVLIPVLTDRMMQQWQSSVRNSPDHQSDSDIASPYPDPVVPHNFDTEHEQED